MLNPNNSTMMKTRILIICSLVLAVCLWLLLRRMPNQQLNTESPEAQVPLTNQELASQPPTGQPEQSNIAEKSQKSSNVSNVAQVSSRPSLTDISNLQRQALADWQRPIEFYGKVIDENSNTVEGANVGFQWVELPTEETAHRATTTSDSEGLFSLHGKRGPSLDVWVSKEGYYASHGGQWGFSYSHGDFSPDPLNPVIFNLRKKGAPESLIHIAGIGLHSMRDYLVAADGKPTEVSLHDGGLMPAGQGDLRVEFQAGLPIDNFPSRISWQCQVTVPGGGLVQTEEEFPFIAPEDGYQTSDGWSITSTNWTEEVDRQYYLKLRDGNFGRVKLRVIGSPRRAFFRMESFLNPSGSRNLEPQN
jgi:hypothetical protein